MNNVAEGAIKELPVQWRKAAYAALIAGGIVGGYFVFIGGPIASARDATSANAARIGKVEADISSIKGSVSDIKADQAARDQKMDDIKDSVDQISQKLDRLLEQHPK